MFNLKYYFNGGFDVEDMGWFENIDDVYNKIEEDMMGDCCWDEEGYMVYDEKGNQID